MGRERFELLDVMRGMAALAVVLDHVAAINGGSQYTVSANLAVDFFFCLSGFVVAHAYGDRLRSGALSYRRFIEKRLIRLYPMVVVGALFGMAAHFYVEHQMAWRDGALSLLMLPRLNSALAFPLDGPMWSLLFELAASVGFGIIVKVCPRVIPWALAISGVALCVCVLLAGHVITFGVGGGIAGLAKGALRIAYPFLLGVVLHRFRDQLPRLPNFVAPLGLVVILAVVPPWTGPYQAFAVTLGLPLVVALGAKGTVNPRLLFLERLSYPLYLIHWPVILAVSHALQGRAPILAIDSVAILASCATGWIVMLTYDEPVRRWLSSQRGGKITTPALAA